ncbi:MAG: hypothetical protein PVH19_13030, partial [Planctomycetia bacterium]
MKKGRSSSHDAEQSIACGDFEALVDKEQALLGYNGNEKRTVSALSPTDEPRVISSNRDYFGLALSGGGIRSATFNLGLL